MSKIVNRQKFEMKSKTIKMTKTKQPFPFIQIFLTRMSSVCSFVCLFIQDDVCQLMTKEGTTMLVAAVAAERASYLGNTVNPKYDQLLVFCGIMESRGFRAAWLSFIFGTMQRGTLIRLLHIRGLVRVW